MQKAGKWSLLLAVAVIFLLFFTLNSSPSIYIDEYWIASIATKSFNTDGIINTSFRNYSPQYINIQPLYIFALGGVVKLMGNSLFVIRLLSALSVLGCTFIMVKIAYRGKEYSWLFFLLIVFILIVPIVWRTAHVCRPEPVVLFAILASLYVNLEIRNPRFLFNLFAGLMLALPLFFYITGVLVLPIVGILFLQELFRDYSGKLMLRIAAIRVIGFILGMLIFFLVAGTPVEVWAYLSESEISKVTVSNAGLLSRGFSYLKYYANYQLENLYFYLPAWILILYSLYKKGSKGNQVIFFVFYGIAVGFLTMLSRKSINYLIYSEIFFVMLLVSSLVDQKPLLQKLNLLYFVLGGIFFCLFYSFYFYGFTSDKTKAQLDRIVSDMQPVIVASIPYKGFFFNNDKFLALEEFEYLIRTNSKRSADDYVRANSIEWAILDNATYEKVELRQIVKYIQGNFEPVYILHDNFVGHRIYDDVPYEWNIKDILRKLKTRPSSEISIYKRKRKKK